MKYRLLSLLLLVLLCFQAQAQPIIPFALLKKPTTAGTTTFGSTVTDYLTCFNGTVTALAIPTSDRLLVGGGFTKTYPCNAYYGIWIDSATDDFALTGTLDSRALNGAVTTAVADGSGGFYISGSFTKVGTASRAGLARLTSTGAPDLVFAPTTSLGTIAKMATDGSNLYVASNPQTSYGQVLSTSTYLPFVSGTSGLTCAGFNTAATVAVSDGSGGWYMGGSFTTYQGASVSKLAHINADCSLDTGFLPNPDGTITALALRSGTLYAAGSFTTFGGVSRRNMASISTTTAVVTGFNPTVGGEVYAIDFDGSGNVIIGGNFVGVGVTYSSNATTGLTLLNISTGLPTYVTLNGSVSAIAKDASGNFYIAGSFTSINGTSWSYRLAKVSSSGVLVNTFVPYYTSEGITALHFDSTNSRLWAGGSGLWVYNGSSGARACPSADYGMVSGQIMSITQIGSIIYVAGGFSQASPSCASALGSPRDGLAAFSATGSMPRQNWAPTQNGTVYSLFPRPSDSTKILIGGSFTTISTVARTGFAVLNATATSSQSTSAAVTGYNISASAGSAVLAIYGATTSAVYIGGTFTTINGAARNRVAALDLTQSTIGAGLLSWDPNTDNPVTSISPVPSSTDLYLGGTFVKVGTSDRAGFAQVNSSGVVQSTTMNIYGSSASAGGGVSALQVNSTNTILALGGSISYVGGTPRRGLAILSASDGTPTAWSAQVNGPVYGIVNDGTNLFVAGNYTAVNGSTRNALASLSLSTAALNAFNANLQRELYDECAGTSYWPVLTYSLALSGSTLYVGGEFNKLNGSTYRSYLAAVDKSTGTATSWNPSMGTSVTSLALSGTNLYAVAGFTYVVDTSSAAVTPLADISSTTSGKVAVDSGGTQIFVGGSYSSGYRISKLSALTGALDTGFHVTANGGISDMELAGSYLYAGGNFTSLASSNNGTASRTRLAKVDKSTGAIQSFNGNVDSLIYDLQLSGSTLYVAGDFTSILSTSRTHLAAIDTSNDSLTSLNVAIDGRVRTMAVIGSKIYLGGSFSTVAGSSRTYLAAIDTAGTLDASFTATASSPVSRLVITTSGKLYAAGYFESIGGSTRYYLAGLDPTTGLATSFNPHPSYSSSNDIAVSGNSLMISSSSTNMPSGLGITRNYLAALALPSGYLTTYNPNPNGAVSALADNGSTLYVAGSFTTIGGSTRNRIAALDRSTAVATGFDANANGTVSALEINGSTVYAGGSFTNIGGQSRNYLAGLNLNSGNATVTTYSGATAPVTALKYTSQLYFGMDPRALPNDCYTGSKVILADESGSDLWTESSYYYDSCSCNTSNSYVHSLTVVGTTIYAGDFSRIINSSLTGLSGGSTIVASGSNLYVATSSTSVSGQTTTGLFRVAANSTTLQAWSPAWSSNYSTVNVMAADSNYLYIGGNFPSAQSGYHRRGLIILSTSDASLK